MTKIKSNFLTRLISGTCFVAIIVGFFFLSSYIDVRLFSILLCFVSAVGTIEVARALKNYTSKSVFYTQIVFGSLLIPIFYLFTLFFTVKESIIFLIAFILFAVLIVINEGIFTSKKNSPLVEVVSNILPLLYPSLLLFAMNLPILMWDKDNAIELLLLTFIICPLCDTFAYLVGMTWQKIRKGNAKKLCPRISPKKTIAGGIGGLIGAIVGGLIVYFTYKISFENVLIYCLIGFVSGIACQCGDLFESLIKRKVGIKDIGKIMPGHGGIMDRFDGITFTGALLFLIFYIVRKI